MVPSRDQSLGQHFIRVVRISHDDEIATYGDKVTLQEPYVAVCKMCERNTEQSCTQLPKSLCLLEPSLLALIPFPRSWAPVAPLPSLR